MTTANFIVLAPDQRVGERPFTHPRRSREDMDVLRYMIKRLLEVLETPEGEDAGGRYHPIWLDEPDGRRHRMFVLSPEELLAADYLFVVGFFGTKRCNMDEKPAFAFDQELIGLLSDYPSVLSYSSMEHPDGNWSNLVLFGDPSGVTKWRGDPRHSAAAADLSPQYYHCIRLHNAEIQGGLAAGELRLVRTKYFDFDCPETWRAIREFRPSHHGAAGGTSSAESTQRGGGASGILA